MGTIRLASLLAILALAQTQPTVSQNYVCPTTKAPVPRFTPPQPWQPLQQNTPDSAFLIGTPGLWTFAVNTWALRWDSAGKVRYYWARLPYFSERYDWKATPNPPLAVVARRLDAPAPLVWSTWVNNAGPPYSHEGLDPSRRDGAMLTSLEIPSTGCWEISAHFTDLRDKVETLTYVVLID